MTEPGVDARRRISVVICAYTEARWDDLVAAVQSVQAQADRVELETIVVIDHDPSLLERARRSLGGVRVTENVEARGLSGARNSGVALATGHVVAFMDGDAVADADWLPSLLAAYDDPSVTAVGGTIRPWWKSTRPAWWPPEFDWVVGCTYRGMPTRRSTVRNLIGCNMSFRRSTLREVGGFVHGIGRIGTRPLGAEETELCIRVSRRWPDTRIVFEPAAAVDHRVPDARTTFRYFRARCYAEGLSKAAISRLAGPDRALATERGYVVRTLLPGIRRGMADALGGDRWGLARATMIATGLFVTSAGYLIGLASIRGRPSGHGPPQERRAPDPSTPGEVAKG